MHGERRRPTPHLGALLHERNRYRECPPDFYALGQRFPSFRQYLRNVDDVKKTAALPFDDPYAVRELTKTLLAHDFGLEWTMPIDRLCPPLPNRLNYVHWIEDLLQRAGVDPFDKSADIRGIDIGTGASCIYALLGAKMNEWRFVATEIDGTSFESARDNVIRNHLEHLISVQRVATTDLLQEPLRAAPKDQHFYFSMCNPPFFDDMDEADTNPDVCCMGASHEMVFPGGEVSFIGHMIDDSIILQQRVLWYTSMVGRKSSLRRLLALLREKKVPRVR
ncbi:hypothetical protein PINS_up014690 [Pythium insidiosum]|nr:hypothetical protein PINS_up014690 [Pythium insidiosum]